MLSVGATRRPATSPLPLLVIGLGGAGMSGIARVLLQSGVEVSGSDARDSRTLRELEEMGAEVHVGHAARNLGTAETLVVSSAIREDNPELVEARRRGLRVLPRAAALGALLLDRVGIAVSGTHGKTTTTSMLTVVLQHLGAEPGYVIGGKLVTTGLGADAGVGDVIAVEADESASSVARVFELVRERAVDAVSLKIPKLGGLINTLAAARSFVINATAITAALTARGLPATFIADLQAKIAAFDAASGNKNDGKANRVGSTAALAAAGADGLKAVQELRTMMRLELRESPELLAAWTSAARVEKPARKPKESETGGSGPTPPPSGS